MQIKFEVLKSSLIRPINLCFILCFVLIILILLLAISFKQEPETGEKKEIVVTDQGFKPSILTIPVGTTVIFRNLGEQPRWPASNIHPTHDIYPEFDPQEPISASGSWEFKFDKGGEWRFHDHLNSKLVGNITVVAFGANDKSGEKKEINRSFLSSIKFNLWDFYFRYFPEDKDLYASKQNISSLVRKKDEAKIAYLISLVGSEKVIINLFNQSGRGERFNCHTAAHTVGRVAFLSMDEKAIQQNISLCHSGYQHGVMSAFISTYGVRDLVERLDRICEKPESDFGKLTCYHGVGHGLMGYYDNELPTALNRCLSLGEKFKQDNCMVGVFMENIGSRTGDSVTDHPTEWLKEGDPHFPCNSIDKSPQVQNMCYSIQPDWMNTIYKNDFSKIIAECMKAPEDSRSSCFFGVGQESALAANFISEKIIEYCSLVPDQKNYPQRCYIGSETVLLDYWGPNLTDQGVAYCNSLPEVQTDKCYEILNYRLKDLGRG